MTVSLCVIAYNEEKSIRKLLTDIKNQDYDLSKIELVFVDNLSTDNTKKILEKFELENIFSFKDIKICTCTTHMQSACWNIAIENSTQDVLIRVDAHASIPTNFVSMNVLTISQGEFVCGGGRPNRTETDTPWQRTMLTAEENLFGNFVVYRKKQSKKQYVTSVFHACYKREVFTKVGGFNEALGRTEDNEFHYRVRKNGYKICLSPDIASYQNIRPTLLKMAKQKYSNGLWIGLTTGVCLECLNKTYFAPLLLVLGFLVTGILSFFGLPILLSIFSFLYLLFILAITVNSLIKSRFTLPFLLLPLIFCVLHFSYGIGTLIGLVKMPFWKKTISPDVYKRIDDIKKFTLL